MCPIPIQTHVCEDERARWPGAHQRGRGRMPCRGRREGFCGQRESRPDWAATETLSAAWLPPKDSRTPSTPEHLTSCVSSLSLLPPLSPLLSSLLLLSLPSITLRLLPFFLISFTSVAPPPPPPTSQLLVWAITDTQQRAETWGWAAVVVG